ncbi:hypothetical protein RQP54_11610 [Curvibacter sp. APW13]|uniref:hypothetical protein n=1 Tax=Curvibacter sp. APW13 TaxID=3077236 RepID=UPI0028DF9005|nr:hypothetical protein [Curvibacter sp. APW13]MDT8991507.1 hypothetical protein [Curvibacter sp. APW13]
MTHAVINRLIAHFQQSLSALGACASMQDVERLAMVVHRCMGAPSRAYHDTAHVFALCTGATPIQTLAALFHDTVYCQLDAGLPSALQPVLAKVVREHDGQLLLDGTDATTAHDPVLRMVCGVFGFRTGQVLPAYGGMNEFLSAVAAARLLAPLLPMQTLLHICTCIEATIAFRTVPPETPHALEQLHQRVLSQLQLAPVGLAPEAAEAAAQAMLLDAVALANRDVSGFAEANPAVFLSQTWLLIEESNKPLASVGLYTLREYRGALQRMEAFLCQLHPTSVFQSWHATPDTQALVSMTALAASNIGFSLRYLRAKLMAMAVLEAFAQLSGGDAPIAMLLGDVSEYTTSGMSPHLRATGPVALDIDAALHDVLAHGRSSSSQADLSASPTTAFLYQAIGEQGLAQRWPATVQFFADALRPWDYLQRWPAATLLPLLNLCIDNAISRQQPLLALRQRLQDEATSTPAPTHCAALAA